MITTAANAIIAAISVMATAISVGISQGKTNQSAFRAIDLQPTAKDAIAKLALLSSALIETAAILGVFIAVLLLLENNEPHNLLYSEIAKIGIGFAIIATGFVIGLVSSWPASQACFATARQPFIAPWIFNFTLIVLSIIQTPLILAFIVALFIKAQAATVTTLADSFRLIGAGISIGIGSIGPAIGLALFSYTACKGLGINRNAAGKLLTFTLVSQAIIESPIIFAMVISLVLLFTTITTPTLATGIAMLSAGIAMGLGTLGPGLSSGRTAATACQYITRTPNLYTQLARTSIFAQGIIDTAAIYVLLVSFLMIFVI